MQGLYRPPFPFFSTQVSTEVSKLGSEPRGVLITPESIQSLLGVIFHPEIHNSGYYTSPQTILPTQTKDNSTGMATNSRSSLNQYCCQENSLSDYTLRQGISKMLNFFLFSLASNWHTQTRAWVGDFAAQNRKRHSFLKINSQPAEATGLWLQTNLLGTSFH